MTETTQLAMTLRNSCYKYAHGFKEKHEYDEMRSYKEEPNGISRAEK